MVTHCIRKKRADFHIAFDVIQADPVPASLPFEDFDGTQEDAAEQFGEDVLERVNFDTGRVRPNASLDIAGGVTIAKSAKHVVRLQAEVRNLTNRFDVINFAGLFS